jgi:heat shock protein HtpX
MWELIRANKRNSIFLMVIMAVVLLLLGFIIGMVFTQSPEGGFFGLMIATVIWLILTLISLSSGDQILLTASRAQPVTHEVHPQLFNVVEEMKIAAGLPAMPKIYIINDHAPNAFATGRNPQNASVAVTAGLLGRLNRDELQGVIAHEISHIVHRDILFVTLAGIMLGSIVLLSQVFLRGMFYGSMGGSRRRYSSGGRGGGQAQLVMLVIAIVAAIVAPIMAYLLYFALSRQREYLADAGAARLTRYPEGLASALEKIASDSSPQLATVNKVTAPMYIVNPFKKKSQMKLSDLTSTHPPISERIRILRNMTHGASYKNYSDAFTNVTHKKTIVPIAALSTKEDVPLRQAGPEETKKDRLEKQMRQVGDIMRRVNQFVFLTCTCGLKLKIPPNFKDNNIKCPRCQRVLEIPTK